MEAEKVFAYGSNMCSGRFHDYGVVPDGKGVAAVLKGYRLCFNKRSRKDGSGKGNIEPQSGSEVWGVLYTIPEAHLQILDEGEGPGYRRKKMELQTVDGAKLEGWVNLAAQPSHENLRPYAWYKRFIVEGAKEHGLPEEYIKNLERIEASEDPDKQRDQERRALSCGSP